MKNCLWILFISLVIMVSCSEDDSSSRVGLQFEGRSESIALKSAKVENSVLSIEEARIGIIEVELEAEYEEEQGEYEKEIEWEVSISGPFQVDLLSGISTPEIILMDIEPGMDYEFECEVSNVLENGKSLYIQGKADVNGTTIDFIFKTNEDFSIEIEGKRSLNQPANVNDLWTVVVDFDYVFNGISFDNVQVDGNNSIVISSNSNQNLYNILVDRFESSFEFEDDN